MCLVVVDCRYHFADPRIRCACLQRDNSLATSKHKFFKRQNFGKHLLPFKFKLRGRKSQPFQTGTRENDSIPITLDEFAQASWYISTQRYDPRVRIGPQHLALSPNAAGG